MRLNLSAFGAIATSLALLFASTAHSDGVSTAMGPLQTLSLEAVVTAGAEPLTDVSYQVQRLDKRGEKALEAQSVDGLAVVQVPKGKYRVTARYLSAKRQQDVVVGDRPSHHVVDLKAGTVRMKAISNPGAKAIPANLNWEIYTYGKDSNGKRHLITSSDLAQPAFTLAAGWYLAKVKRGGREVRHTIEVSAGITYKYTVVLR